MLCLCTKCDSEHSLDAELAQRMCDLMDKHGGVGTHSVITANTSYDVLCFAAALETLHCTLL